MSTKKTVKTEKKNPLSTPLIISMCANFVLLIAMVVMGVYMGANMGANNAGNNFVVETNTPVETSAPAETGAPAETEEPETYTFETEAGESVEVILAEDARMNDASYICAGDETEWDFNYDEETGLSTLIMTEGEEDTEFGITFFLTTDEENARLLIELTNEEKGYDSLWYLSNLLDEDGETFLGMVLESAVVADTSFVLCTPEYYEEYQASLEEAE